MKVLMTYLFTLIVAHSNSQNSSFFKLLINEDLKISSIFKVPILADLNNDKIKDYAVLLQNRKNKDKISLLIIYSSGNNWYKDTARIYKLKELNPDLGISIFKKSDSCFSLGSTKFKNETPYTLIKVSWVSGERGEIIGYDENKSAFRKPRTKFYFEINTGP